MKTVKVWYENNKTLVEHLESNSKIVTSRPKEYGGPGDNFSSTDLLIASLGNCIITTIDSILLREGADLNKLSISLSKELLTSPKELKSISMNIEIPLFYSKIIEKKLNLAINSCPVYKCLSKGTQINTCFYWKE